MPPHCPHWGRVAFTAPNTAIERTAMRAIIANGISHHAYSGPVHIVPPEELAAQPYSVNLRSLRKFFSQSNDVAKTFQVRCARPDSRKRCACLDQTPSYERGFTQ